MSQSQDTKPGVRQFPPVLAPLYKWTNGYSPLNNDLPINFKNNSSFNICNYSEKYDLHFTDKETWAQELTFQFRWLEKHWQTKMLWVVFWLLAFGITQQNRGLPCFKEDCLTPLFSPATGYYTIHVLVQGMWQQRLNSGQTV